MGILSSELWHKKQEWRARVSEFSWVRAPVRCSWSAGDSSKGGEGLVVKKRKYKSINVPQYFANCGEWLVAHIFNDDKAPFLSSQEPLIPNWGYQQEGIDLFCFSCNFYQVKVLWAVKKAKQKTHFVLWRGTTTTHLRRRLSRAWSDTPIEFGGIF